MSFVEELRTKLEDLWPIVTDNPIIDQLSIDINLTGYNGPCISVYIRLEGDYELRQQMDFEDDCEVLTNKIGDTLRAMSNQISTSVQAQLKDLQSNLQSSLDTADAIKQLAPTPLEELAMAAE